MSSRIPVAMTLRPSARNLADIARVQQLAAQMGFEPTGEGRASLTFRISSERFQELFSSAPREVPSRGPGSRDSGAPGGYAGQDLPVPDALDPYVETVAVVPPATRLR